MFAPDAVRLTLFPAQTLGAEGETEMVGFEFTVTVAVEEAVHPALVPVTVYVVVVVGFAVTVAPVDALRPVTGDQLYVVAPLAVKLVDVPEQIATVPGDMLTLGIGFTVTVVVAVHGLHPPVPVTV